MVRRNQSRLLALAAFCCFLSVAAEAQVLRSPRLGRAFSVAKTAAALTPTQAGLAPAQSSSATASWVRRIPNPPEINRWAQMPGMDGVIRTYVVYIPATASLEAFTLYAPDLAPGLRAPMLAAFHAYGVGWLGIQNFSGLIPEAIQRGWFLVAPWQRNTAANANVSYGSVTSQLHVEAVMDLVLRRYSVDRDRIYGIGFSMGGGNALSYAARHRDRRQGAIAAVVNHTGSVALANVYANVTAPVRDIMDATFGGDPQSQPFEYQRSSVIELDSGGNFVPSGRHMAINLDSVPVQSWFNTGDNQVYLREQTESLFGFMSQRPGAVAALRTVAPFSGCDGQHCWDTVDRTEALNWLGSHVLNAFPSTGAVLMDRSGRWGAFDVTQAAGGAFTSFQFAADDTANTLEVLEPENVAAVGARVARLGLRVDQDLAIKFTAAAGGAARLRLVGWAAAPTVVSRDGVTQLDACPLGGATPGWCFDSQSGAIEILETSPGAALWVIKP